MTEASARQNGDGEELGGVVRETYLVPQGHLPVVPSGCAGGQQFFQIPQKQHFVGPVPLVAGFLEGHVQPGSSWAFWPPCLCYAAALPGMFPFSLQLCLRILLGAPLPGSLPESLPFTWSLSSYIFVESYFSELGWRQTSAQLHALAERLLSTHSRQGTGLGRHGHLGQLTEFFERKD